MIVFVDESYKQDAGGKWHYALAGFGIDEFRYRALQAAVYQLVRRFFVVKDSYVGDAWRAELSSKIVVNKSADEIEIKAQDLLPPRVLRKFGGENAPHYRFVAEILDSVSKCKGTCFGVLINPTEPQLVKDCSHGCPETYQQLI